MFLHAFAVLLVGPCAEPEPADTAAVDSGADTAGDALCEGIEQWYDADGDGWGDALAATVACTELDGYSLSADDCDDIDTTSHPGAADPCGDGIDQDCDGVDPSCEISPSGPLAEIAWAWTGGDPESRAGSVLAEAGDLTGDGELDIAVGAPVGAAVWVLPGPVVADPTLIKLQSEQPTSSFGHAIAATEDENLDGVADLWIGGPDIDWATSPPMTGAVWHAAGPFTEDIDVADKVITNTGMDPVTGLGTAITLVQRFSADTQTILAIGGGIPIGAETGGVYLTTRRDAPDKPDARTILLPGPSARSEAGATLAGIPDADGDGGAELAVGAPGIGAVYILGTTDVDGLTLDAAGTAVLGAAGSRAGDVIAGGDLDGDGIGDLLVGGDRLYVLSGPFDVDRLVEDAWLTRDAPAAALSVGDFDGDGLADLVVGGDDAVALWLHPAGGALGEPDRSWTGEANSGLGAATLLVDRTGDGVDDLFVGAPNVGDGGAIYVLPGGL